MAKSHTLKRKSFGPRDMTIQNRKISETFFSRRAHRARREKMLHKKISTGSPYLAGQTFWLCVTLFIAYTSFKDLLLRNTLYVNPPGLQCHVIPSHYTNNTISDACTSDLLLNPIPRRAPAEVTRENVRLGREWIGRGFRPIVTNQQCSIQL